MNAGLPEIVRDSHGGAEPFEPERITRRLFAAAKAIGKGDAFLARELTEGVLHFLTGDGPETTPAIIAETVAKIVRELGHPDLARAYETKIVATSPTVPARVAADFPAWFDASQSPRERERAAAWFAFRDFTLERIYPPELVSADAEGLIRLHGMATPFEMAGSLVDLKLGTVRESFAVHRAIAGDFLVIDGPEHDLANLEGDEGRLASEWISEVRDAAGQADLLVIANLNCQQLPLSIRAGSGPLFASQSLADEGRRSRIASRLVDLAAGTAVQCWWHLAAGEELPGDILDSVDTFVFDRPRQPIALAPGLDRDQPSALIRVGLNLVRLIELMGGPPVDAETLLKKAASLTRFAKTAGHVKQDFLRKHARPALREAFRLDRARLVLVPGGVMIAAQCSDRPPLELARDLLKTIRTAAITDRPRSMLIGLDSPEVESWADADVPLKQRIRSGAQLQAAAGGGCLELTNVDPREALLLAAETSLSRLRIRRQ